METDWQSEKTTLKDRYEYLWKTGELFDCRFRAGDFVFRCHKLILAAASPVFKGMFYGEIPVQTDEIINIEDIESDDFKDLLYYIYCNTIDIRTVDKAANLYYAAKKYMLNACLTKQCIDFLHAHSGETQYACYIYIFGKFYEELELLNAAMEIIRRDPCGAIANAVHLVDISTVVAILDEAYLGASELPLFQTLTNHAIKWRAKPSKEDFELFQRLEGHVEAHVAYEEEIIAEAIIQMKSKIETDKEQTISEICQDLRSLADELAKKFLLYRKFRVAVKKIEFLALTANEFLNYVAFSGFLLPEENAAILRCICDKSKIDSDYPKDFRKCIRFRY